jgi:hypothetical protein
VFHGPIALATLPSGIGNLLEANFTFYESGGMFCERLDEDHSKNAFAYVIYFIIFIEPDVRRMKDLRRNPNPHTNARDFSLFIPTSRAWHNIEEWEGVS